jgi:cytidylate kinase
MGASTVSAHADVRAALLDLQRQAGRGGGVVLEGRDIGSVVFPNADVKFFLTARADVRAKRRYDELVAKGDAQTSYEATLEDVRKRDAQDMGRAIAPLKQADDAVLVDSSEMGIEATVAKMAEYVRSRMR